MSIAYAWEKFNAAVSALSSIDASLRERLISVVTNDITYVQPERDLPDELRLRFKNIVKQATNQVNIHDSISCMDSRQLSTLANDIVSLYDAIVIEHTKRDHDTLLDYNR